MANDDTDTQNNGNNSGKSIIDAARNAINKAGKEAVTNKAKDILKRKAEHDKASALCLAELEKLVTDYEAGLL